ncbi:MAG: hypothetical protein ACRDP3_12185 [Streptomyces sp.]|uniref:hypothetical protein n=1 Tax=Streptomyces sp. TaxID=1931 RepID=UPI003D6BF9BC
MGEIQQAMKSADRMLQDGQAGVGKGDAGVDGLASTAAQRSVLRSWERRLDLVARECAELKGKLEKAGDDHYKNDSDVRAAFKEQLTKPREHEPQPHGSDRRW